MNLLNKCYDLFSSFIIILIQWRKYWKYDVRFIFEWRMLLFWGKYMWQWSLCSTIFQKTCGNDSHEKEAKPIYASAADLLLIISEQEVLVSAQEKHLAMQLLWASSAWLIVTQVSLSRWVLLFVPGVTEWNREAGWI